MAKQDNGKRDPDRERWIAARSNELRVAEVDVETYEGAKDLKDTVTGGVQGWRWSYQLPDGYPVGHWGVRMPTDRWAAALVGAWMESAPQDAALEDGVLQLKGPTACWSFSRLTQACGRVHYPARGVSLRKASDTRGAVPRVENVEDQEWLGGETSRAADDASGDDADAWQADQN